MSESTTREDNIENNSHKQKSLRKNSVFYLFYTSLNLLFPFVAGIYVARVLLPDDIGQIEVARNLVSYFVIFSFLGIPTYGFREIAKCRNNQEELNKVYTELRIINNISALFFSLIYVGLIFLVPSYREHYQIFLIAGILVPMNFLNNSWLYLH